MAGTDSGIIDLRGMEPGIGPSDELADRVKAAEEKLRDLRIQGYRIVGPYAVIFENEIPKEVLRRVGDRHSTVYEPSTPEAYEAKFKRLFESLTKDRRS